MAGRVSVAILMIFTGHCLRILAISHVQGIRLGCAEELLQIVSTPLLRFLPVKRVSDGTFTTSISGSTLADHMNQDLNRVIHRHCSDCSATNTDIYYKRLTPVPDQSAFTGEATDFVNLFTDNWMSTPNNILNTDFKLYSTYDDAINDVNAWTWCDYCKCV
mmetsp:Transcript_4544/g.10766  ORF Transcript_4544/g.10766 Transcript_4544/m.10766 type:complete len:161 (-) Transcript_4544:720-1202(-)